MCTTTTKLRPDRLWRTRGPALAGLLLGFLGALPAPLLAKEVVVLLDTRIRPYVECLAGFQEISRADGIKVLERVENGDLADEKALIPSIRSRKPDMILAVGGEALQAMAGEIRDIPILFCMVINPKAILGSLPANVTGVSLNVPAESIAATLDDLLPQTKRVGVVYDPDNTVELVHEARQALSRRRKTLEAQPVKDAGEVLPKVKDVLAQVDIYWMLPDNTVNNTDVVRYLFFAARQQNKALIGISPRFTKAGALFSLSAEYRAEGRQAGAISNQILAGSRPRDIPVAQPSALQLTINSKVAASLGIDVPQHLLRRASKVY